MADFRELIFLTPAVLDARPETPTARRLADLRMAARRFIVRTSRNPILRPFYRAFYNLHLWVAAQLGKRFAGTLAVYLSSGMATGDINLGISDIDLAIYGNWPEARQFRLMKLFGLLTVLFPLFDRASLASMGTPEDIQLLHTTDMMFALTHAKGARQWKLLYGEPILGILPKISPDRFAGCVYADHRRWWSTLSRTCFGRDILARDTIFRNSICFKTIAETLRAQRMLATGDIVSTLRGALIEQELPDDDSPILRTVLASAVGQHLQTATDPREPTLHWFLHHAERFHHQISPLPFFAPSTPVRFTGSASDALLAPQTSAAAHSIVAAARNHWPSLTAAFLVPCAAMLSVDSFGLLLELPADSLPSLADLRRIAALHLAATAALPQRLALYLLLPGQAYLLDANRSLEFFHYTLLPEANPDVFHAIAQPENTLYGSPRPLAAPLGWSHFAQEIAAEELYVRRGAYARFGLCSTPTALGNLRNFWRFLQMLIIERSLAEGEVHLPMTLPAIRSAIAAWHPATAADLLSLEAAFRSTLQGAAEPPDVAGLIARIHATVTAVS